MKKLFKILFIMFGCLIILSVPTAYLFGSSTHADLKGTTKVQVNEFVKTFAKEKRFNGSVLVIHKGKVLLDQSYGMADQEKKIPFSNEMEFPIGSVTKSMTAVGILQLEENGKLSVNDEISKFLPDFPSGSKIKIHHLLNHSSGLGDYLKMKDYTTSYSDERIMKLIESEPIQTEPGEKFKYVNSDYYLLGKIIEKVSGEDYATYIKQHIFDKAAMHDTSIMNEENKNLDVKGYEQGKKVKNIDPSLLFAVGNVISTKNDLAKYIQAIESHQLLSKEETNKMLTKSIKINPFGGYGYGWYVSNNKLSLDEQLYWHGGSMPGLRTGVMRYQEKDLTIIIFSNMGEAWNFVALGNEIASIVFDKRIWFFQKIQ